MKPLKLSAFIFCLCFAAGNNAATRKIETRKPLNPTAKQTVSAINTIIHGALSMVEHKDNPIEEKQFDNGAHELAHGIVSLILAGARHRQQEGRGFAEHATKIKDLIVQFINSLEEMIM